MSESIDSRLARLWSVGVRARVADATGIPFSVVGLWRDTGVPARHVDVVGRVLDLVETPTRYAVIDGNGIGIAPYTGSTPPGVVVITRAMTLFAALKWAAWFLTGDGDPVLSDSIRLRMTSYRGPV